VRIRFFGALDLDPQASLVSWGERRKAASTPNKLVIEPFEGERLPLLHAILEGLAEAGFTIAVFDTAANSASARLVAPAASNFARVHAWQDPARALTSEVGPM
jgi:hypothetical protein